MVKLNEPGLGSDEHPHPPSHFEDLTAANRLGLPVYEDDQRAPADTLYWNATVRKVKYKARDETVHNSTNTGGSSDGGGGGISVLSDSGSDNSDGGNQYQLPNAEDSLDFQSAGDIRNLASLNGGGPVSDGDGTKRQIWVVSNGASDPAGAGPEDIIFEEQA